MPNQIMWYTISDAVARVIRSWGYSLRVLTLFTIYYLHTYNICNTQALKSYKLDGFVKLKFIFFLLERLK